MTPIEIVQQASNTPGRPAAQHKEDHDLASELRTSLSQGTNMSIETEPGFGMLTHLEAVCRELGIVCYELHCAIANVDDVQASVDAVNAISPERQVVLVLADIDNASTEVSAKIAGLLPTVQTHAIVRIAYPKSALAGVS